jgi:hypothetical protein
MSGNAILGIQRIGTKFLNPIHVWSFVRYLRYPLSLLILPLDLDTGFALNIDAKAVLHDRTDE